MPAESHDPLPYREVSEDDYAKLAADRNFVLEAPAGGLPVLSGTCPRCRDFMIFPVIDRYYRAVQREEEPEIADDQAHDRVEPLICTCVGEHPGRPAGAEGCGAYWTLRLTLEP
jgi:hypothetical protein